MNSQDNPPSSDNKNPETPEKGKQTALEQQLAFPNNIGFFLLDEANPQLPTIELELEAQKRIAADKSSPLEQRLEAFEDIVDSEIGDTSLTRARNIEREVGLRQIFLKFEGGNPTGT